jgi:recombination protein RecT
MAKDDLKTAVATRAAAGIQPGQDKIGHVAELIQQNMQVFAQVIPSTITPERLTRIALTTIKTNKALLACDVPSLLGAIMQCARFGFEPNTTGECYIIPYKDKAQFQLGYIGHLQLLHRSGMVAGVGATEVCANDERDFSYGPGARPFVRKAEGERGPVVGYFAWIELRTGGYVWQYMTRPEVEAHRKRFSKMPNGTGWRDNFDAMALKTVLLKAMKFAPKSVEINSALFADNRVTTDYTRIDDAETTVLPEELMNTPEDTEDAEDAEMVAQACDADAQLNFSDGHE